MKSSLQTVKKNTLGIELKPAVTKEMYQLHVMYPGFARKSR